MKRTRPRSGESFVQWFARMAEENDIEHFSAWEFTTYFERRLNTYPPKKKWANIIETLRLAEALRRHFKDACHISSSYRSEAYNRSVGGASHSMHKEFNALDIQFYHVSPKKVADMLHKWRRQGLFKGGIGRYKTFTHVDTRGYNATWGRN